MKVDLDARTLEAMRVVSRRDMSTDGTVQAISQAVDDIRAFLAAHDSARDAERDEVLLTSPEKDQLLAYIQWAEEAAVYYGVKRHFDKRHARIRKWAFELPTVESERARRTEVPR